jgi:hypothetical protein
MPAWLITFLTGIIKPIVESIIEKLLLNARLNAIEKDSQALKAGFSMLAEAKTPKEVQDAAHAVSSAWNRS